MKEENGMQDVGATAFDMPNSQKPKSYVPAYYGNQYIPKPTNHAAKIVNHSKIMDAVNEGK
jgi:hypothetical protein